MNSIANLLRTTGDLAARGVAYAPEIASAASRFKLDPRLLAAVAAQETGGPGSNGGRNVLGDGGHGRGLFQIDDRYHAFARSSAAMNPAANADYAAGMLSNLLKQNGGDIRKALSAYNAGDPNATGTVTTWQDGEQLDYADSVLRHYAQLGGSSSACPAGTPAAGSGLNSLMELLDAESAGEQANVNSLSSFAGLQLPTPFQPNGQQSHSYRQLAGLDNSGNSKSNADFASIIDADDSSDQ
jgi:hypothetical protein